MRRGLMEVSVGLLLSMALLPRIHTNAASDMFVFPLGYHDGQNYAPRIMHDSQGNLIENTDFDAQNPDLSPPSSCFGPPWRELHHAGEDLYRDGRSWPIPGPEGDAQQLIVSRPC